jgi:1-acyl-sn-glycerol-3-phosphate acyltransferase
VINENNNIFDSFNFKDKTNLENVVTDISVNKISSDDSHTLQLYRNPLYFSIIKLLGWSYVKSRSNKHYEIPRETLELMHKQKKEKNTCIYYVSTHKSLWETLAIPYAISWHDGNIPFVMMGNNLVKSEDGWRENLLLRFLKNSGVIPMERKTAAVKIMIDDITKILSAKRNIFSDKRNLLIFAEGTRSRTGVLQDFKPAAFEGLAKAVSSGVKAYIVPIDVGYSNIIELETFAGENELNKMKNLMLSEFFQHLDLNNKLSSLREIYNSTNFLSEKAYQKVEDIVLSENTDYKKQWSDLLKAHSFKVNDSNTWKVFIDNAYLSFGQPIFVEPSNNSNYRRELSQISFNECSKLVKILETNIVGEAIVRMNPQFGTPIFNNELYSNIIQVVKDLEPYKNQFRGFSSITAPSTILKNTKMEIASERMEIYKILSNQISHYLPRYK